MANVGLVLVSHSARLAVGLAELLAQIAGDAPVVTAGGLADGSLGTDAVRIAEAMAEADRGRGVLVLMDLGSAVLSSETALELVTDELRERVQLSPAPFVEGAVAAAVAAAGGDNLAAVAIRANEAIGYRKLPD